MTSEQKQAIQSLRSQGQTYNYIAAGLGMSINTVKTFCRRNDLAIDRCKLCGKPLVHIEKHKPKTFCNDRCRLAWWKANREQMNKKAIYHFVCRRCGKPFDSYGNRGRKYCSHACYIAERFGVP